MIPQPVEAATWAAMTDQSVAALAEDRQQGAHPAQLTIARGIAADLAAEFHGDRETAGRALVSGTQRVAAAYLARAGTGHGPVIQEVLTALMVAARAGECLVHPEAVAAYQDDLSGGGLYDGLRGQAEGEQP